NVPAAMKTYQSVRIARPCADAGLVNHSTSPAYPDRPFLNDRGPQRRPAARSRLLRCAAAASDDAIHGQRKKAPPPLVVFDARRKAVEFFARAARGSVRFARVPAGREA